MDSQVGNIVDRGANGAAEGKAFNLVYLSHLIKQF